MSLPPALGICLVLGILVGLMGLLQALRKRFCLHPETVRKTVHILMGLVTLTFPWIFTEDWPVLLLAVLSAGLLAGVRFLPSWRNRLGGALSDVSRDSLGEIYFPIAVCIVFIASRHDPILYGIPILVLTMADAVSALIGFRYGFHRYDTRDGEKSTEGSAAFFLTTFLAVHVPLLLFTPTGRAETLAIGLMMACLVTLFEAIAWRGLDNLFIPLASFILLKTYLGLSLPELWIRLAAIGALLALSLFWGRRTTLTRGATLGAALSLYIFWAVAGWVWLLPPVLLFVFYREFLPKKYREMTGAHDILAVLAVGGTGFLWLFARKTLGDPSCLFPFTLAFACHLAMIAVAHLQPVHLGRPALKVLSAAIMRSWAIFFGPYILIRGASAGTLLSGFWGLTWIAAGTLAFFFFQSRSHSDLSSPSRWLRQGGIAAAIAWLGYLVGKNGA